MTRTQRLIVTTAVAFALPFGAALAQTPSPSAAAPVAFSADKVAYTSAPCAGNSAATAAPSGPAASSGQDPADLLSDVPLADAGACHGARPEQ